MKNSLFASFVLLLVLTGLTSLSVIWVQHHQLRILAILGLAVAKFVVVAFSFMEMHKAHRAWKRILILIPSMMLGIVALFWLLRP